MIWAIFLVFGCQALVFACSALIVRRWYYSEKAKLRAELEEMAHNLITSPDEKTPSPLAVVIDQGALLLASRLMQQIKAMLAGTESGIAKAEGLAAQTDLLDKAPPWLSIAAAILPARLRNQLLRNPQMLGALAGMAKGQSGTGNGHSSTPAQGSFSL